MKTESQVGTMEPTALQTDPLAVELTEPKQLVLQIF